MASNLCIPPPEASAIRRRLLAWYDWHRRDLPWRRRPGDGYAQLLAESMLQQTQVSRVVPFYQRFIQRFPTPAALAAAPLDDVLALWSGLGYYRRARQLHAAARQIIERHGGTVPRELAALMALPGVGRYTAGAIASIAFDQPAPILDGNVARVLSRLLCIRGDAGRPKVRARLWSAAEALLPPRRCGDFNQALMELGATVCRPQRPQCDTCPLAGTCGALQHGLTGRIPRTRARKPALSAALVTAAVQRGRRMLFAQRPADGLWAGLWELPSEPAEDDNLDAARDRLQARLPLRCRLHWAAMLPVTRQLTHRRVSFHLLLGTVNGPARPDPVLPRPFRWLRAADLGRLGVSAACRAILNRLCWPSA